jgi:hypothetical protein
MYYAGTSSSVLPTCLPESKWYCAGCEIGGVDEDCSAGWEAETLAGAEDGGSSLYWLARRRRL